MKVLNDVTIDNLINLYEGTVVADRKLLSMTEGGRDPGIYDLYRRAMKQDKMILGALKCAKAHGYSGED